MSKTILVVEDEGILALLLQNLLTHLGYTCAGPLATGEEALAYLTDRQVDLILLDIELAGLLNGLETARQIRQASDIPIVFLTGFSREEILRQGRSLSPYCLVKPVSELELAAALQEALHSAPPPAGNRPPREDLGDGTTGLSRALAQKDAALRQLDENRRFQSSLLETIPIPVYYKDTAGRYLGFNKAGENFYHRTKAEMIGKTAFDLHPPPLARIYHEREVELFHRKGAQVYETVFAPPQGESRDVIVHEASLTDAHGTIIGVIGAMLDITERKQAEKQLQENRKFLEATAMMIPDVVYLFDAREGRHLYFNRELSDLLGYTNEEIQAAGAGLLLAAVHPKDLPQVQKHIDLMAHTPDDGQHEVEYRIRNRHNNYQWFYVRERVYLRDDWQQPKVLFGIMQDITERKEAEEEKRLLQSQLIQAQKMEAIGTLAGGIAHDFNNILGAILGYAEMVRDDSAPNSLAARDLDQIILASNRAKELVKQILAFSRQADMAKVPLQPAIMIKEPIKLLRSSLPATIAIDQDIDPSTAPIFADPTQIHQILMNICTNAFHAMEEHGGTLSISLANIELTRQDLAGRPHIQPGRFVRLSIGDTGGGIPPEVKDRIFEPYFTTKEQGKGTGLGLAIAHGIAKGHGGFITFDSHPGVGTVFHVVLPALDEYAAAESETHETIPRGREHLLFIDDESMLGEMAQVMLQRLGYTVTVRSDSLEALATFTSRPGDFDLVITDRTMPGMTGIELARRMLQIRPDIPIILCTGYGNLLSTDEIRSTGIKGFALKPLARKEIATLIRKVLEERG